MYNGDGIRPSPKLDLFLMKMIEIKKNKNPNNWSQD
jgi:hypothetical protein